MKPNIRKQLKFINDNLSEIEKVSQLPKTKDHKKFVKAGQEYVRHLYNKMIKDHRMFRFSRMKRHTTNYGVITIKIEVLL